MQIFTMYHLCQNRDDGYAPTYSQGDLLFRTITFAADPPVATDPTAARGRGSGRQAQHTRKSGLCQQQEFWEVVGVCVNNDLVASQSHDEWDWRAQNTVSYRQTADPDTVGTDVTGMDVFFSFMCCKKDSRLVTVTGGTRRMLRSTQTKHTGWASPQRSFHGHVRCAAISWAPWTMTTRRCACCPRR